MSKNTKIFPAVCLHRRIVPLLLAILVVTLLPACNRFAPVSDTTREAPSHAIIILAGQQVRPESHAIFLPEAPTLTERTAAEDLQHHLALITGQTLEILPETRQGNRHGFFIGRGNASGIAREEMEALGTEGLIIRSRGGDLLLAGNQRGVLYAVSVFLEDVLGCRWFAADCATVPTRGTISIPELARRIIPPLENRDLDYPALQNSEFAMHARLNGSTTGLDEKHGGKIIYYPFGQSFYGLVPPHLYKERHPEYFSLVNGKRTFSQLCLTNPDVLQIAIAQVREWIRLHPEASIVSVSQNDNRDACQCPTCQALAKKEGSESGPMIHFVNAIAEAIEKEYPGKLIDTFAYTYTRKPPRFVRPRSNVTVRLASFECCFAHPLATCPANRSFVEDLQGWSKICPRLSIWDYVINYKHSLAPFPNLYVLKSNINLFISNGVTSVFEEANNFSPGGEMAELRTYIIAKTLWNPEYDTDKAIDEFLAAYYGPAAPYVRQYVDLVHASFRDGQNNHVAIWGWDPENYMPGDFTLQAQRLFSLARTAVKDDALLLRRVRLAQMPVVYMMLRGASVYGTEKDRLIDIDLPGTNWLAEFMRVVNTERITCYREGGYLGDFLHNLKPPATELVLEKLTNGRIAVELVPGFGGRILQVRDQSLGVDWMKVYEGHRRVQPTGSGIEDYSERPYHSPGWSEPYGIVARDPAGITLRATLTNGLELERRIELPDDRARLLVRSSLSNPGQQARAAGLRIHPAFTVPDLSRAHLAVLDDAGRWTLQPLPAPLDGKPDSNFSFEGDKRPVRGWGLVDDATGHCLLSRVLTGDVNRCFVYINWRDNQVNLEYWAPERELKPGESMTIEYELESCATLPTDQHR